MSKGVLSVSHRRASGYPFTCRETHHRSEEIVRGRLVDEYMTSRIPRVSIGMPVYNGERFLGQALDSILGQSFEDFELIISDNSSTDGTQAICRDYMAKNKRIKYYRTPENIGLVKNYDRVFELSIGEYFKWAACDDLCAPEFLMRCVEVLDHEPTVILCYPKATIIDERGKKMFDYEDRLDLRSPLPHKRFRKFLRKPPGCNPVYGLMRRNVLCETQLLRAFDASDYILLAEMCLRGQFREVPERLFYRRSHPQMSRRATRSKRDYVVWLDSSYRGKNTFPILTVLFQMIMSIQRVPMSNYQRFLCFAAILGASFILGNRALKWKRTRGIPF